MNATISLTYKGQSYTIPQIALLHNVKERTLRARWKLAGRPSEIDDSMLKPSSNTKRGYHMDGVYYSTIKALANHLGTYPKLAKLRVSKLGKSKFTRSELEATVDIRGQHEAIFEPYGKIRVGSLAKILPHFHRSPGYFLHVFTRLGKPEVITIDMFTPLEKAVTKKKTKNSPVHKDYADPDHLPHITLGDLVHLSSTKNTGAARVGCEQWDRLSRAQRNSMATASLHFTHP